ncbi:MAG: hypothetical protein QNK37_20620 [Acidobacteriota bacterium]|nr:hypothetical protein [Acidobacteriota bacterium]
MAARPNRTDQQWGKARANALYKNIVSLNGGGRDQTRTSIDAHPVPLVAILNRQLIDRLVACSDMMREVIYDIQEGFVHGGLGLEMVGYCRGLWTLIWDKTKIDSIAEPDRWADMAEKDMAGLIEIIGKIVPFALVNHEDIFRRFQLVREKLTDLLFAEDMKYLPPTHRLIAKPTPARIRQGVYQVERISMNRVEIMKRKRHGMAAWLHVVGKTDPNVVTIWSDETHHLFIQHIEGEELNPDILKKQPLHIRIKIALDIMKGCVVVGHHGDEKPSNIIVTGDWTAVWVDISRGGYYNYLTAPEESKGLAYTGPPTTVFKAARICKKFLPGRLLWRGCFQQKPGKRPTAEVMVRRLERLQNAPKRFKGYALAGVFALVSVGGFGYYRYLNDPKVKLLQLAEKGDWIPLRAMYSYPPRGTSREMIGDLLLSSPNVLEKRPCGYNFQDNILYFAEYEILPGMVITGVEKRTRPVIVTGVFTGLSWTGNMPYVTIYNQSGSHKVPFPRMITSSKRPFMPGEQSTIYFYQDCGHDHKQPKKQANVNHFGEPI